MGSTKKQSISPETTTSTTPPKAHKASAKHSAPEVATPLAATTSVSTQPASGSAAGEFTPPSAPGSTTGSTPAASTPPAAATSTVDISAGPPAVTFPAVSATFVPSKLRPLRTFNMSEAELRAMPQVASDLGQNAALQTALGPSAQGLGALSNEITKAIAWRMLRDEVEQFAAYVKAGDAEAWSLVFTDLAPVKALYAAALALNSSIKSTAPGLTALFAAQSASAQRRIATRKKSTKAKLVAQTAAAQAATGEVTAAVPAKAKS
jgi:hypothetical protein